ARELAPGRQSGRLVGGVDRARPRFVPPWRGGRGTHPRLQGSGAPGPTAREAKARGGPAAARAGSGDAPRPATAAPGRRAAGGATARARPVRTTTGPRQEVRTASLFSVL